MTEYSDYSNYILDRAHEIIEGMAVWCRWGEYPWWPSRAVSREEHARIVAGGEPVQGPTDTNRMVVFFNDDDHIAVVELRDLVEFTSNIVLINQPIPDGERDQFIKACELAYDHIRTKGTSGQRERLDDLEPVNVYANSKKSKYRPKKKPPKPLPSSSTSRHVSGKRKTTSKYRSSDGLELPLNEDESGRQAKRRKSKDTRSIKDTSKSGSSKKKEKGRRSSKGSASVSASADFEREDRSPRDEVKLSSRKREKHRRSGKSPAKPEDSPHDHSDDDNMFSKKSKGYSRKT